MSFSTCLSRETVWKQELQAARNHTLSEIHSFQSEYQKATSELTEVTGHLLASKSTLEYFEQQAYTWKEECCTLILCTREKDAGYEAEISSMKSKMAILAGEIVTLRTHTFRVDQMLMKPCVRNAFTWQFNTKTVFHD